MHLSLSFIHSCFYDEDTHISPLSLFRFNEMKEKIFPLFA